MSESAESRIIGRNIRAARTCNAAPALRSGLQAALMELLKAYEYAQDAQRGGWDFAVEIRGLCDWGATFSDLRWLVCRGYVEHGREITRLEDGQREFRPTGRLTFSKRTCFILTKAGVVFARIVRDGGSGVRGGSEADYSKYEHGAQLLPSWDPVHHELSFNGKLVKRFKWSAPNQERVLTAFEEEGWPMRIDDPLPPRPEQDPKRRLHDTLKCLNRNQQNQLVRFRGDGTGEGVVWDSS